MKSRPERNIENLYQRVNLKLFDDIGLQLESPEVKKLQATLILKGPSILLNMLSDVKPCEYTLEKRIAIFLVNIGLSRLGIAPVWRGMVKVKSPVTDNEKRFSCDMQIFDLEWVFSNHKGIRSKTTAWDGVFEGVFLGKQFDFEKANVIAHAEFQTETKLKNLKIPEPVQMELAVLKSGKIRKRLKRAQDDADEVETHLRHAACSNPRRGNKLIEQLDERVIIWLCWKLESEAKSPSNIMTRYTRMTGKVVNQSTLRNKLKSMDAALREVKSPHTIN
jgi:hypothetical protein